MRVFIFFAITFLLTSLGFNQKLASVINSNSEGSALSLRDETSSPHNLTLVGEHLSKFLEQAETLLKQAAEQGSIEAQYNLGTLYGNKGNWEQAEALLKQVQELIEAQINLALLYQKEGYLAQAEALLTQAAEQGLIEDQYNLILLYQKEGYLAQAEAFYKQAAEQGSIEAQYSLGLIYYNRGELDKVEALFKQAAEQGYAPLNTA